MDNTSEVVKNVRKAKKPEDVFGVLAPGTLCAPVLRRASSDPCDYASEIEECTQLPVSVMSFGPTAEDKRWG